MLKDSTIRTFEHDEVSYQDFLRELHQSNKDGLDIYVGSDSQVLKDKISLVTCICFYKTGVPKNSIFYIKKRISKKRYPTLRARMLLEAYSSIEAAMELDPLTKGSLTVHLDVGEDFRRNKTAKFSRELQILVKAQGFGCEIKPNSWASSCVADKYTKS